MPTDFQSESLERTGHLEDLVYGRILLKLVFEEQGNANLQSNNKRNSAHELKSGTRVRTWWHDRIEQTFCSQQL